jgi:hypothetical protein
MNKQHDALTVALTGQLSLVLIVAAVLALAASLFLLRRYRRVVIKSMQRRSRSEIATPTGFMPPEEPHKPPETPATFNVIDAAALGTAVVKTTLLYRQLRRQPWIAAAIYAVAGLAFAATMTAAFLWAGKMALLPLRFSYLTWVNAWPVVLTTNLVATATRRCRIIGLVLYFSVGIALGILLLQRSPDLTTFQLAYLWSDASLIPSVLLLFFLNRRIRSVGPLVLIFMIVGAIGATLLVSVSGSSPKLLRAIVNFSHTIGLGAGATVVSLHLLGFAVFAIVGWVILDSLRQMYERKYLSDRSVTVGTIWLIFGIVNSMGLVFQGASWILSGVVAFAVFKIISALGFYLVRLGKNAMGPRLLLLRVFALGRRSERLYDALGKHWRTAGSIQMIAGPDLATTTVEPHEFLDFVTGKMARRFIDSGQTLDLRIEQMDLKHDSDAYYRVTEFFCHYDTWKITLARLADDSDAVLMDLRGFSQGNTGCIFEINELFNLVPLQRVVFVVDDSTDQQFMQDTMQVAWRRIKERSPNRRADAGRISLVRLSHLGGRELRNLFYAVSAAAAGTTGRSSLAINR